MIRGLAALGLACVLGVASAEAVGGAGTIRVHAVDDAFRPGVVRVTPGTTVTWVNVGHNPHTVTADDGSVDSGNLDPGETFTLTIEETGSFAYHCRYHGAPAGLGMAGVVVAGTGTGPTAEQPQPPPGKGRTLRVPADHPTIQEAVDSARPGDLVLVSSGTYREAVVVETPFLTIRGTDRNGVVLGGEFRRISGIRVLGADGVTIENMTARRYLLNGFYWTGVSGYRGSYLTAYNDGDYGIYAIGSVHGLFDHSYASGHPDSGFYIGQCQPCHALITDVVAERNGFGYSGTNAGGNLVIASSEWRHNQAGIVPNTLDSQLLAPQRNVTIVGNWVHDNGNADAPTRMLEAPAFGMGILVTGGVADVVERNLVEGHPTYGIAVMPNIDQRFWIAGANRVRENVVRSSGIADLALGAPASGGNCFSGNDFAASLPPAIETLYGCGFSPTGGAGGDLSVTAATLGRFAEAQDDEFPRGDWETQPAPPPQPSMAGAATAPPAPAVNVPSSFDPGTVPVPVGDGHGRETDQEVTVSGIPLAAPSWWALLVSVYGYALPFALYAAWLSVAFWDLARRDDVPVGRRAAWMAFVLVVPIVGPILYFALSRSPIPGALRLTLVGGGLAVYALFAGLSFVLAAS